MSQLGTQGVPGIWQVEAKDAAKQTTIHRTTRNYPAPNVNSAEVEEPWVGPCSENRIRKRGLKAWHGERTWPSTLGRGDFQLVIRATRRGHSVRSHLHPCSCVSLPKVNKCAALPLCVAVGGVGLRSPRKKLEREKRKRARVCDLI